MSTHLRQCDVIVRVMDISSASTVVIGEVTKYRHGPGWFACHGTEEQLESGPECDLGAAQGYRAEVLPTQQDAIRWVIRQENRQRRSGSNG